MAKGKLRIISIFLCAALALGACAAPGAIQTGEGDLDDGTPTTGQQVQAQAAADDIFSVAYESGRGINPIIARSAANLQFSSLIYDYIYTVDENFEVSSEVVTAAVTEDNSWWVFTIDTDIKFSDGSSLTAADVAYSIQRATQVDHYAGRLYCVYGVGAMSADTFAITAIPANSQLPSLLNIPIIKSGSIAEDFPIGTGPYKLADDGQSLVLSAHSRRAQDMPIDTVYLCPIEDNQHKIASFESALLDIVTNDPTGMNNLGYGSSNDKRFYDTTNMHYIGYNLQSNFFQSYGRRYAVSFAIDRALIVQDYMQAVGVETTLPVHPSSSLYDASYAERFYYDSEKAFELFTAAGVADHDSDGDLEVVVTGIIVEINLKFIVNTDSSVKLRAARKIAETLNSMGITTTLYELQWTDYEAALRSGDYDMYYGEMRLTPDWNISMLFEEEGEMSFARNRDTHYSELYRAYLAASEAERYGAFQAAVSYVMETGFITPICFERREVLSRRGVIMGIRATQFDLFNNFSEWTINLG